MQSFILRGDLGNVTKRKNLLGVHFCGLGNRQLFAKLNQRYKLVFELVVETSHAVVFGDQVFS